MICLHTLAAPGCSLIQIIVDKLNGYRQTTLKNFEQKLLQAGSASIAGEMIAECRLSVFACPLHLYSLTFLDALEYVVIPGFKPNH